MASTVPPSRLGAVGTSAGSWAACWKRYERLGETLPGLLEELNAAAYAAEAGLAPRWWALLSETCTGVAALAYALGYFDLGNLAMDSVEAAAHRSQDPLRVARTRWQRSTLFLATAGYRKGAMLLERVRCDIGEDMARMDEATLSVYGAVHLRSAIKFVKSTKGRLKLFLLPGYSPHLNPDEWVWKTIKHDHVGRLAVRTKDELKKGVEKAVERLREVPAIVRNFFLDPDLLYITT